MIIIDCVGCPEWTGSVYPTRYYADKARTSSLQHIVKTPDGYAVMTREQRKIWREAIRNVNHQHD